MALSRPKQGFESPMGHKKETGFGLFLLRRLPRDRIRMSQIIPITDLEVISSLAKSRFDEFEIMRYMLVDNDDLSDSAIDALVDEIAAPIVAKINCMECANCCRSLQVSLTPSDAQRLADGLSIPFKDIVQELVDLEAGAKTDEWGVFRHCPCTLLKDKRCSVYAHRPESCHVYPTFTPDFRWTLEHTIAGASGCPIIYNVLDVFLARAQALGWA